MRIFQTLDGDRYQFGRRERQVVRLAALGRSNKQIAGDLSMGLSTVKQHLRWASRALGLTGRVELTLWCCCHPEALAGVACALLPRVPACLAEAA